jgi:hypothetical protein
MTLDTRIRVEGIAAFILGTLAIALTLGPYVTHIVWCIGKAGETGSAIALLLVGMVIAPVGWLHGLCLWAGWSWI